MSATADALQALQDVVVVCRRSPVNEAAIRASVAAVEDAAGVPEPDGRSSLVRAAALDVAYKLAAWALHPSPGTVAALDRSRAWLADELGAVERLDWSRFEAAHLL